MVDYVSGSSYTNDGSSTSIPIPGFSVSTGNLLVVGMRWEGGGATDTATASLADTAGNTYTLLGYQSTGSGEGHRIAVFYCLSAVGNASNAITVTISASRTYRQAYAAQYSYSGTLQLGDTGSGANGGDTTTVTSSPALTAKSGDVVVGVNGQFNLSFTFTPNAGYTARDALGLLALFDNIPSGSFNEAPGGTYSSTGDSYVILTAVFETVEVPTGTSGGLVVGSETSYVGEGFVGSIEAQGLEINVGVAVETDKSPKSYLFATRANEADASFAFARGKIKSIGFASETNTALNLAIQNVRNIGMASETDSAIGLARTKLRTAGVVNETDSAFALSKVKQRSVGIASETDAAVALDLAFTGNIGTAIEIDSASALTRTKIKSYSFAGDSSSTFALTKRKARSVAIASEVASAFALAKTKARAAGISSDTSSAFSLAKQKIRGVAFASESDSAYSLTRIKFKSAGWAESANIALAPSVGLSSANPGLFFPRFFSSGGTFAALSTELAVETDSAYALTRVKFKSVGMAQETDLALPLGTGVPGLFPLFRFRTGDPLGAQYIVTGRAESADTAFSLQIIRQPSILMVRWAQETPVASALTRRKIRAFGIATSANTAAGSSIGRRYAVGVAESSNLAIAPSLGIVRGIGTAVEVDTATQLVYRKLVSTKIAESLNEALAMATPQFISVGVSTETDTAIALSYTTTYSISLAVETDTAFALRPSRIRVVGTATEFDTAFALNFSPLITTKVSQSFNTAFAITTRKLKSIGMATSTNTAWAPMLLMMMAQEKDVACFLEVKRNGVVIYPPVRDYNERRMWTRFLA